MRNKITLLALLFSYILVAQIPCENGFSGAFPCSGYDLISQIPLATMNSVKANDSWGWTDPQDGKEYAIICLNEATAFIDVSEPLNPIYLGQLPGSSSDHTTWRDAKTYNNFVFIVSEDTNHGMQVFDLTRLRDVPSPPVIFTEDAHYSGFGNAHNIVINEDTGYAYGVGTTTFSGGPHFINIQDPLNLIAEGGYAGEGYTHDAQVVIYDGPDTDYTGQEIFFGSNETHVAIVNVTDKSNPEVIATVGYTNVEYTHQGWLTENHRYFILGDETDEINLGINSRTIIFDFEDLDNPLFHFEYEGPSNATDHNGYVKDDKFYLANNAAGMQVIDISEIENSVMTLYGYFDSFPQNNNSGFNGSWNVYPYFESGNIVISDRAEGLLLVRSNTDLSVQDQNFAENILVYPNPAKNAITVSLIGETIHRLEITDLLGKSIYTSETVDTRTVKVDIASFSRGVYFVRINGAFSKKIIKV
jgi:choice-of-anchor B domain-containing protein